MDQLHTEQQIKYFDEMNECAGELIKLHAKYGLDSCKDLANEYKERVKYQLDKYSYLIGRPVKGVRKYRNNEPFIGKIESISHFNNYSKSVRVNVRYADGEYDGFGLKNLTLIDM